MKYLIFLAMAGTLMYLGKKFDNKLMCLDPEDFKKWMNTKRLTDPFIDKKYQDYLAYVEKMKPTGWKVVPFVLYYEGSSK